jgi:hypothetical protein
VNAQYSCEFRGRVAALRALGDGSPGPHLNGIEYLEVDPQQRRLFVRFVHDLAVVPAMPLTAQNVEIRGGVRIRDPRVTGVAVAGHVLTVDVDTPGDFSPYVLRLVASPADDQPPAGIDPALAGVEFSFKAGCPSDFDCRTVPQCPTEPETSPALDYLARDYASFRRLMLDRLSTLLPGWRERSPADLLVTLVELIAFRGDELSYFQDAVTTEAYLGTARTRVSVRRHARLLDYPFHDGASARVWVAFETEPAADGTILRGSDPVTGLGGTAVTTAPPAADESPGGTQTFELLHPLTLYAAHGVMRFYTWSDEACCLPAGATRAFLRDDAPTRLRLRPGDVLVLEERLNPATGIAADADRTHRHPVRLTHVDPEAPLRADGTREAAPPRRDPLTEVPFVEIRWDAADALPFSLCLSTETVTDVARAVGNVGLADHGRTLPGPEILRPPTDGARRAWRPLLAETLHTPLTQQVRVRTRNGERLALVDPEAPATAAFAWDMADVRPAVALLEGHRRWTSRRDLIASDRFASEFVVETEDDGRAYIRFGDGVSGRRSPATTALHATYRLGAGRAGNVGADTITRLLTPVAGVLAVRNPLPARGGADPHPITQAKLYAPQAFRRQERAVTVEDYQAMAGRHPDVQHAVATRRWTGSWHTTFVTADRRGGRPVDVAFEGELTGFLERFRLAGHDIEIDPPRFVPLDVALDLCVAPDAFASDVKRRLLEQLGAGVSPRGVKGFFHPDNLTFGAPVRLSALLAHAMRVPGVVSVAPIRFQRLGRAAAGEIEAGVLPLGRLEIARLDNDPSAPEQGRLNLAVRGGA